MKVLSSVLIILSLFTTRPSLAGMAEEKAGAAAVMSDDLTAVCEGTQCPMGCCPEPDWYCCVDNFYCASEKEFCPKNTFKIPKKEMLITINHLYQDCSQGTLCEGGCCERPNWHCCDDGISCASHPEQC